MDVQLKRRADLIPNIVAAVKGYMEHERGVLEDIATLRTKIAATGDTAGRYKLEGELSQALSRFLAVAENYPQLRASENFVSLQNELAAIEEALQMSRRYYNGAPGSKTTESSPSRATSLPPRSASPPCPISSLKIRPTGPCPRFPLRATVPREGAKPHPGPRPAGNDAAGRQRAALPSRHRAYPVL
jgi:LemA protein